MQAKKGKRKKRTFFITFAMNTNFLLLFPFFGDILYSLISILCFFGHSHSSIDNSYELFICCTCYDNLSAEKRQKKNDDADASPLKLVLECRDFNVALLFESLGNIPEKREESVLIAVPHA